MVYLVLSVGPRALFALNKPHKTELNPSLVVWLFSICFSVHKVAVRTNNRFMKMLPI